MDALEKMLDLYFVKKAPGLPKNIKEVVVSLAPWIEIVGAIMTIPSIFSLLGFNAMMYGTRYGGYMMSRAGYGFSTTTLFLLVGFILMIMAIPGLLKRTKMGWNYVFYGVLLNAVYSLITMQFFGLIVGGAISLYLLFQVKNYYK